MQREILQEKSLSRKSGNAEKTIGVDLSGKAKLIPHSSAADMLSLNELYIEERNACENYRMIFTVNPVCTNVLYNAITEPVYREGSDSALTLVETPIQRKGTSYPSFYDIFPEGTINQSGESIDRIFAVRDTEISHERVGGFKYYCGFDIFNNHLLRSDEFEHAQLETVQKSDTNPQEKKHFNKVEFNTIFDFAVDYSGNVVTRVIDDSRGPVKGTTLPLMNVRMYQLDNIKTMNTSFYNNLRAVDGWYGFYNSGYINIPNATLGNEPLAVNRILNNETPCAFVDLYPDRSLYSFIPKVNRYRRRLERNWDCTIVYPYANDYDMFNFINCGEISGESAMNAVKVLDAKVTYNNVGDELIQFHSMLRHTLKTNDYVRILYLYADGDDMKPGKYLNPVRVVSVGDANGNDANHYFSVLLSDVAEFCKVYYEEFQEDAPITRKVSYNNLDDTGDTFTEIKFFYRKIENGYDDRYYFRKFKQLKNYEYVYCFDADDDDIPSGITIVKLIREPSVINDDSPEYIQIENKCYELVSRPLTYTQNKIAFGENIYGDRVAQVIFNDDICVSGLKDNLGRPLSTVYFTAVKTNRGHREWYDSGLTADELVEYSHCFSDVTSGLDLPESEESTEYNVRKLYNVFADDCDEDYLSGLTIILSGCPIGNYSGTPTPLETEITVDDFDEFYGDIVEFSKANFLETTIEKVYHRFNTAQRECLKNNKYYDVFYDELVGDLYDVDEEE